MAGLPYDPHAVEAHWRAQWEHTGRHRVDLDNVDTERAFFNLVEFPYPSADGLHVGHIFKYSGADAYGRYQRMRGRVVFQPIGWDAFGIHTENFALRHGRHPADVTGKSVENFRAQLSRAGMQWDWSRLVDTSRPDYYRWTQWVFIRLFEAGLAYQAEAPVLWCPSCLTVLAREQVEDECCERCSAVVTERVMRQWFLRMTAFADRLLTGLDELDWPERAKRLQRAWIGRQVDEESGVVSYRMHDWLISRQRYWGPPIPIIHCERCGPVAVPDDQLPVLLPEVDDPERIRPTGTGRSPLADIASFVRTPCPSCAAPARRETDVSDTFLDSAWYFLRYVSTDRTDAPWDAVRVQRWLPVDFYAAGSEHVQRHHLYARFVTMAMHDLGLVPFEEPFTKLRLGGLLVKDGAKMSKSRGNVVNPDDLVAVHGSDVVRLALLFIAPWEAGGDYHDRGLVGAERFLTKLWRRAERDQVGGDNDATERAVAKVTQAIEKLRFNVAIASLMEGVRSADLRVLVRLLAPLAPHIAEELWSRTGGDASVHDQRWPAA